jgi:hypothetical protein
MRYISIILMFVFCVSCNLNRKTFNTTSDQVTLDTRIDSLLEKFLVENNNADYQYFLITYFSCNERIVTFIANNVGVNYYNREKSLFYFIKDEKKIYIITGIEDFFKKGVEQDKNVKERSIEAPVSIIKSYLVHQNNINYIPNGIPPFAPPPSQEAK